MQSLKSWIGVLRLWSLTASTVPVLVGAALAALEHRFSVIILAVTLLSGWLLQVAANLLNTYGDFRSGVDSAARLPTAPQLVDQSLQPRAVFRGGGIALFLGAAAGIAAAAMSDWRLLFFAAAGIATAALYTTGLRLKYLGLGLPLVSCSMGVLMVVASYFSQTRIISFTSIVVSLPVSFLVGAILHGNDLRDIETDRAARIQTSTLIVGERNARAVFYALHLAPYPVMGASVASGLLPAWSLLCLLALPLSLAAVKTCESGFRTNDALGIGRLEGISAGTHFLFGLLLSAGIVLARLFTL